MQRRDFLKFLGLGAAAVAAPAALVEPEPIKRYWFFGERFYTPTVNTLFQGQVAAEWRDDPKYSQIPMDHGFTYNAGSGLYTPDELVKSYLHGLVRSAVTK
jgi:hypothetical protein